MVKRWVNRVVGIYIYTHTLYMFVQYVVGICVYIYIHIYLCVSFNKRTENAR